MSTDKKIETRTPVPEWSTWMNRYRLGRPLALQVLTS